MKVKRDEGLVVSGALWCVDGTDFEAWWAGVATGRACRILYLGIGRCPYRLIDGTDKTKSIAEDYNLSLQRCLMNSG